MTLEQVGLILNPKKIDGKYWMLALAIVEGDKVAESAMIDYQQEKHGMERLAADTVTSHFIQLREDSLFDASRIAWMEGVRTVIHTWAMGVTN